MAAGRASASTPAAAVAPMACPSSLVVSSIPEAAPRCLVGSEFMIVALLMGLNMFVPIAIGSISSGSAQNPTCGATIPSVRKPAAIEAIVAGRSHLGRCLS